MSIRLIITGGTFDKRYDEITGALTLDQTHLPEILQRGRCTAAVTLEMHQLVDSLEMQDSCRRKILTTCQDCPETQIIVTHGTDTMTETAAILGRADLAKTVVLTGAMVPHAFGESDAVFNLGCAIGAVQTLPRGVYIAMNGRLLRWDNVRKNRQTGVFEQVHPT